MAALFLYLSPSFHSQQLLVRLSGISYYSSFDDILLTIFQRIIAVIQAVVIFFLFLFLPQAVVGAPLYGQERSPADLWPLLLDL